MAFTISPQRKQALRTFALQILNTTLAVLIALSFDGLVEWYRIRKLVATAQAHMDSEITENRADIASARTWAASSQRRIGECLQTLDGLIAARQQGQQSPTGSSCGAETLDVVLNTTSRSTAEATGALGHMSYEQLKRYAGAYSFQESVSHTFQQLADHYPVVLKFFKATFNRLDLDELKVIRGDFVTYLLLVERVLSQTETMLHFYDRALGRRS
jgi:hypothetical protein